MGKHELEHALRMLEQICANFAWETDEQRAAEAVASHLKRFWAPEMRTMVTAAAQRGETSLSPLALGALKHLG